MLAFVPEGLRCVFYTRVSSEKQVEDKYGMDLQETDCRLMAQLRKWVVLKVYKDDGYSGTLPPKDRPALKQLLEDANERNFDIVLVYSIDRIGRTQKIIIDTIDKLQKLRIGVSSTKENFDTSTPQGLFVLQMFAGMAQLDRSTIIQKTKKGKDERRKKKGWTGGKTPYGYKLELGEDNKNIVAINKNEALIVTKIFDLKNSGMGLSDIANYLNDSNVITRSGTQWSRQTIYKILGRKIDYEGGIMNDNENNIRWPKII